MDLNFRSGERPKPVTAGTPTSLDVRRRAQANAAMVVGIVGLTSIVWLPFLLVLLPPQIGRDSNVQWTLGLLTALVDVVAMTLAEGTRRRGRRIAKPLPAKATAGMICGAIGLFAWPSIPWVTGLMAGLLPR